LPEASSVPEPTVEIPSRKVTVPVGVASVPATLAVKWIGVATSGLPGVKEKVTTGVACATTTLEALDELPAMLVVPRKVATIECVPTARLEVLRNRDA